MITNNQKETIIATLGKHYSKVIIPHLTKLEIFNSHAEPFSKPSIRKIVNGDQDNKIVENEILELVRVAKLESKRNAKKWNNVTHQN